MKALNIKTILNISNQLNNLFNEEYLNSKEASEELKVKQFDLSEIATVKEIHAHPFFNDFSQDELNDAEVIESFLREENIYVAIDRNGDTFTVVASK